MDTDRLNRILNKHGKPYVFAMFDDEKTSVMEYGNPSDLLFLLHSLYHSVKNALVKQYGKSIAEKMMRSVSMTDEEIRDDLKSMKEKKQKEIPAWLKRLMEIDFDEDDITFDDEDEEDEDDTDCSVDETDRDEKGGDSEEDEPTTYHFRGNGLHLDLRIYPDDAVRSDD